jgi:tricorn protease
MRAIRPMLAVVSFCISAAATLSGQIDARLLRQPDVSATQIAFVYAGDIWVVPKAGGLASRLSSPRGEETFPRFSPDGAQIAFTGNYDGNEDVYVMPAAGGVPKRLTHHPAPDRMLGWYPDGKSILFASPMASGRQRFFQLYKVSRDGGLPELLPVPYGEFGAISPDGEWLAYVPQTQDFRTWKRYRGGWASRIWLYNLRTGASKQVAPGEANNSQPMWHGKTLYFLSDRGAGQRQNIWAYDPASDSVRQVTRLADYDIHFPAAGPSDVVFESGGRLSLLDLATERTREVPVQVVTDLATLRPHLDSVGRLIQSGWISPTGKRALFEARGDIFSVPAENGPVLDLTRSAGVAERWPTWSPDGKSIAYWSDRAGEYQLVIRPADGSGAEETVTSFGPGFRFTAFWSPDNRKLAFIDQTMTIRLYDRDTKKTTTVDNGLYMYEGGLEGFTVSWSADSRWVAYARDLDTQHNAIFLFDSKTGSRTQATSGFYDDQHPAFDPDGKYLYFLSNRRFAPSYGELDNTWIYANMTTVVAVPLRRDVPSPLAPKDDEEPSRADSAAVPAGGAKPPAPAAAPAAAPSAPPRNHPLRSRSTSPASRLASWRCPSRGAGTRISRRCRGKSYIEGSYGRVPRKPRRPSCTGT